MTRARARACMYHGDGQAQFEQEARHVNRFAVLRTLAERSVLICGEKMSQEHCTLLVTALFIPSVEAIHHSGGKGGGGLDRSQKSISFRRHSSRRFELRRDLSKRPESSLFDQQDQTFRVAASPARATRSLRPTSTAKVWHNLYPVEY